MCKEYYKIQHQKLIWDMAYKKSYFPDFIDKMQQYTQNAISSKGVIMIFVKF